MDTLAAVPLLSFRTAAGGISLTPGDLPLGAPRFWTRTSFALPGALGVEPEPREVSLGWCTEPLGPALAGPAPSGVGGRPLGFAAGAVVNVFTSTPSELSLQMSDVPETPGAANPSGALRLVLPLETSIAQLVVELRLLTYVNLCGVDTWSTHPLAARFLRVDRSSVPVPGLCLERQLVWPSGLCVAQLGGCNPRA